MTPTSEEYTKQINSIKSNMCRGCTKIVFFNGKATCYFTSFKIGFWNNLLNMQHCEYNQK